MITALHILCKSDYTVIRIRTQLHDQSPHGVFPKVEATMKKYAFNRWASDKMSLKRQLPDVRHATCRTIEYDKDLPSVSGVYYQVHLSFFSS